MSFVGRTLSQELEKSRDLQIKQQLFNLPQHKLKGDVSTRWGSTYEMVSRIVEQQQAVSAVLVEDRKYWNKIPTDHEFTVLETLVEVLGNVSYLTDALAGEQEVTISALLCILKHINSKLSPDVKDSRLAEDIKETILQDLNDRYSSPEVLELLDICSFLDPRFMCQYLKKQRKNNFVSYRRMSLS